ncbi:MAG: CPBP family intramembrane glutamic endopeptidase [Burkholderiaceae bacterium]
MEYQVFAQAVEGLRPSESEVAMSALRGTAPSTGRRKPSETPPQPTSAGREHISATPGQHPLWLSALLHLMPGAALSVFVVALHSWGVDPLFALLFGIGVVITPLELGYLAVYAKRTTGSWSPFKAVTYTTRFKPRQLLRLAILPALWMLVLVAISMGAVDERLATSLFDWMPSAITEMATPDNGTSVSGGTATALVIAFFVFNGLLGPITEELYFRGHLLPRIDRYGRGAPVLGTLMFALYHFHSPWRYPAIFLGFLPVTWMAWRKRSLYVSLTAHLIINNVFILMMVAALLGGG